MIDVGTAVGYLMLDTTGFQSGFRSALADLKTFQDETATTSDKFTAVGSALSSVGGTLTKSVTLPLVGLGTAVTAVASNFETSMSKVAAIAGLDTVGEEFDALSAKAKEMGATTKFSASETADAFTYMAMAGWKTEAMLEGIEGIMNLAAASGEDLALTSDIVTDALTAFGMQASDSAAFADILAAASNNANTNVAMLGESFKYVAPVAGALGYSAEDTSIALGLMANSGIKASQAGTALRTAMSNLVKPTDQMAMVMDEYGISLTDADGNMKSFMTIMTDLRERMGGLDEATQAAAASTLFGKEAMSGMLAIINASDADFDKLTKAIYNADGTAKRMADTMQNNLSGQLTILKSALEGLAISFGEMILPVITSFVQWITKVVDKLNSMDESTKKNILTLGAIAAAIGPVLLVLGKLVTSVGSIMGAFSKAKLAISGIQAALAAAGTSLGAVLAPIAAVVAAIAVLVAAFKNLWTTNEEFRTNITATWNQIKEAFSGFTSGILERINSLGFNFSSLTEAMGAVWNEFCNLLAPVFEGVFNNIAIFLETIFGVLTSIFDVFKGLFTGDWELFWQGISDLFTTVWEGLYEWFSNILVTLQEVINVFLGWFGTSWSELWTSVANFFQTTWNNIKLFFSNLIINITTVVSNFITSVVNFFATLPENIAYHLGFALGKVARWIVDLATQVLEVGPQVIDAVVNFFSTLPGRIWEFLSSAYEKVSTWVSNLGTKATEAGTNFLNNVVNFFQQLPTKMAELLTQAINKIKEWGNNIISWAKSTLPSVVSQIVAVFQELPGKLLEIGKNLVNSLWEGIKSRLTALVNSIKSFASTVIGAFKSGFGIASPSKETRYVGDMLMEGLTTSISGAVGKVRQVVDTVTSTVLDTFSPMTDSLSSLFSTMDLGGGISGVLNSILEQAQAYDSLAESIRSCLQPLRELQSEQESQNAITERMAQTENSPKKNPKTPASPQAQGSTPQGGNTYIFNSPKAVVPTVAAKLMKQTAQQLALDIK